MLYRYLNRTYTQTTSKLDPYIVSRRLIFPRQTSQARQDFKSDATYFVFGKSAVRDHVELTFQCEGPPRPGQSPYVNHSLERGQTESYKLLGKRFLIFNEEQNSNLLGKTKVAILIVFD